jgi:transposase
MRDPRMDPAVGRRMAMVRYARTHNKSQAARHFGCCWATIQAAVTRVEAYERTGDVRVLQNKARGKSGRTSPEVEALVVGIYEESFEPERPKGRRYSAAKVARLLAKRHQIELSRKTVWLILRRREVWERAASEKRAVQRFERAKPNELWQIDLIEKEPTAIGDVYGVPILDDNSRYLVGLRFFLTKGAETTLLTCYMVHPKKSCAIAAVNSSIRLVRAKPISRRYSTRWAFGCTSPGGLRPKARKNGSISS